MKINWGTGIVIAFIAFISFILYFVIGANTNHKYEHDLVTDDYYKQELNYQKDIDKLTNAKSLAVNISYEKTDEGLRITFPENLDYKNIKGTMFLYRPSNKQLDFETSLSLSDHFFFFFDKRLVDGRWNIKVDWQYNGKNYLYKKEIIY